MKYILVFILLFLFSCTSYNANHEPRISYFDDNNTYNEEAIVFLNTQDWNVQKDSQSLLLTSKRKENIISTIFVRALRLEGELNSMNFAEQLTIAQIINGADVSSFSKKTLKNGKISITEILQEKRVIYVKTVTKNNAGYVFVCMGKKSQYTIHHCNKLIDLIYIR